MGQFVDLGMFKKHVRVDDYDGDDDYLEHCIEVGEQHALDLIESTVPELLARFGSVPAPVVHAAMILGGQFFSHPEATESGNQMPVPYGVASLLKHYDAVGDRSLGRSGGKGGDP